MAEFIPWTLLQKLAIDMGKIDKLELRSLKA